MRTMQEKDVLSCVGRATFYATLYAVYSDLIYNKSLVERSERLEVHIDPKIHFLEHVLQDLGGYKFALDRNLDPAGERYDYDILYLSKHGDTLRCKLKFFNSQTKKSEWWSGTIDISDWSFPDKLTPNNLYATILPQYGLLVHEVNRQRGLWQDPIIMQINWTCLPQIYDQLANVSLRAKEHSYQRQLCIKFVFQLSGQPEKITYQFVIPVLFLANLLRSHGFPLLNNNNDMQAHTSLAMGCKRGQLTGSEFCENRKDFVWKFIYALLALGLVALAIFVLVHYPIATGGIWALTCVTWSLVFGIQSYRGFFKNNAVDQEVEWCNNMLNQMRDRSVTSQEAITTQVPLIEPHRTTDQISDYQPHH